MLIVMAGLPATGKSAVSRRLKQALDAVLLDKDQIRACLFDGYVEYSRLQDDLCVNMMYDLASFHLDRRPNKPVILDGRTYSRAYQIDSVKSAASRDQVPLCIIECVCSHETALIRLQQDKDIHLAQNRDATLYEKSRANAEPITEPRFILNTDEEGEALCAERALGYIRKQQTC